MQNSSNQQNFFYPELLIPQYTETLRQCYDKYDKDTLNLIKEVVDTFHSLGFDWYYMGSSGDRIMLRCGERGDQNVKTEPRARRVLFDVLFLSTPSLFFTKTRVSKYSKYLGSMLGSMEAGKKGKAISISDKQVLKLLKEIKSKSKVQTEREGYFPCNSSVTPSVKEILEKKSHREAKRVNPLETKELNFEVC